MKKVLLVFLAILIVLSLTGVFIVSLFIFPAESFSLDDVPAAPDYADSKYWAALPDKLDKADVVPGKLGENRQASAAVDVFYLYPTSYILARHWNASLDDSLSNAIVDNGILPQQASAFNGVAKVYAPRYRQVSLGGQMQQEHPDDKRQALDLAYTDVKAAFDYYMENYNQGRPFLIASHSQGTTHAIPLLKYLFSEYPQQSRNLVAGYLIGNTVLEADLEAVLDVCRTPLQSQCYLSWNAMLEGGDTSHWYNKGGEPVCVNPLSWRFDSAYVSAEENLGAIPLTGHIGLDKPHEKLVGARCEKGILWITEPDSWLYKLALFPGGGYHAYDYNLFYMNIRDNVEKRVAAFLN